jgi:hypothetical protein
MCLGQDRIVREREHRAPLSPAPTTVTGRDRQDCLRHERTADLKTEKLCSYSPSNFLQLIRSCESPATFAFFPLPRPPTPDTFESQL